LVENEEERKKYIDKIDKIIYLKLIDVNKRLKMYFGTEEPFYGYYDPDEVSNNGIIINITTNHNEIEKILFNFPIEEQDDENNVEKFAFKEVLEQRCNFYKEFDSLVYWITKYNAITNKFETKEKIYHPSGIKGIEIIKKKKPDSKILKKFIKIEKLKELYNVKEIDPEFLKFIENEITEMIIEFSRTNKLETDDKINKVITETIEQIKQEM
jgi:hypothetical protein